MKRIGIIAVAAALVSGFPSCDKIELPVPDEGVVRFSLSVNDTETTKSCFTGSQSAINNYKVFIYRSGSLVDSRYWSGGDPPSFTLQAGSYDFYVVCNAGNVSSLGSSPDSWRYSVASASAMVSGGIPMAGKQSAAITTATTSVSVTVTRLVSKYNLYVQRSFEDTNATFTVTGVKVCQAAADVLAFGSDSTPTNVLSGANGDYATTADLSCLNSNVAYNSTTGAVSFYMFENARGTLLSGNTDPWKKCYDTYGGLLSSANAQLCTYLELTGTWATAGASETVTYRMFLGQDNCTNFDVLRNKESNVTLILSDTGKERDSWKIEDVTNSDTRSLAWERTYLQMYRSGSYNVSLSVTPSDMVHNIYYASDPASPSWQKLTATSSGHVGHEDASNRITLDYNQSTHMLTISGTPSTSITQLFTFALKAQTTDGKASTAMTVDVASGTRVDYTFHKHWNDSNAKYVYAYGASALELVGGAGGSLSEQVNIRYDVGRYTDATTFQVATTQSFSVQSGAVRGNDYSKGTFYFNPSTNRAYYYTTAGTTGSTTYYLRIYLNGMLCEEHEVHALYSWFVPSGNYEYAATDFLDQTDCGNPPTLFVKNVESVYLKLYDPVEKEILSSRLLFIPAGMLGNGSSVYANCDWDYNDMEENGISYDVEEDPEDHDLYFEFTNDSDDETSFWEVGYNHSSQNAFMDIATCEHIPAGDVKEVNVTMTAMLDNACAGSVDGTATVEVDFSAAIGSAAGLSSAPTRLSFGSVSSGGYLPSYSAGNPSDPYQLGISYRKTSSTKGELTFRKSFCGDLTMCWENVSYTSSGKVGYKYNFHFKVRAVFDVGGIYVPVYSYNNGSSWNLFANFTRDTDSPYLYRAATRKGVIRRYPLAKSGTNGCEVFQSLVSYIRQPDFYTSPYNSQSWVSYADYADLSSMLVSARVKSSGTGSGATYSIHPTTTSVTDYVGSYNWAMDNVYVDGYVRQEFSGPGGSGKWVTSTIHALDLRQIYSNSPLTIRLAYGSAESSQLQAGQSYEYSNPSQHLYFKATAVNEFYNTRFDAWAWKKIVYE